MHLDHGLDQRDLNGLLRFHVTLSVIGASLPAHSSITLSLFAPEADSNNLASGVFAVHKGVYACLGPLGFIFTGRKPNECLQRSAEPSGHLVSAILAAPMNPAKARSHNLQGLLMISFGQ